MARQPQGKLADVSGKHVSIDPQEHYDNWADTYDRDLLDEYGYSAHRIATRALADLAPDKDISIIDVGCGTGLVGLELVKHGFSNIDGVDISRQMMAKAEATGVYRDLIWQNVEETPVIDDGAYDAVICAGSFGIGHMGPEAIPNLISMAAPGKPVIIFMNAEPFVDEDYPSHISQLETRGIWTVDRIEDHNYMDALDRPGKLIIAHRNEQVTHVPG
jgi:SAM-dependent methyltransferase